MDGGIDWQNSCRDLKSRGQYILENEKWTDCTFLVGSADNQQTFKGHKLILAMGSPVFDAMFFGNLPENKDESILIPDVQPDAFKAMLEYIYTDKINISSFDKACELCYVAKKYILPFVVEHCTNYLWSDLSAKNACRAYEFAKLFEEPRLMKRCLQIISTKTREVLADPSFMDIELSTLLVIYDQEQLSIDSELDLFNALQKYAVERGLFTGTKPDDENLSNQNEVSMETASINGNIDVEYVPEETGTEKSAESSSENSQNENAGEGTSKQDEDEEGADNNKYSDEQKDQNESLIKEAVKKIRFLTLTPQQFGEGPARSTLLTQAEALSIFINISSPNVTDCSMPEGFCKSRIRRNCIIRCDENSQSSFNHHEVDYTYSPPNIRQECTRTPPIVERNNAYSNFLVGPTFEQPEVMNATMETRKFYCIRTIRQQIDYRNTSVTDCALTFHVDTNILITGVQVPTQVLCGELMNSAGFTERYSEILYAHLLDAQGSRLTYTHCTSRVRYDSLLEISFDRPVFIHRNKIYKIGVVFNKVGWYPMYTCYPQVTCDTVHFIFNVGPPHESLRDGLIRAIVFTHPVPPANSTSMLPHYAVVDVN